MTKLNPYENSEPDLDAAPDWEQHLIDIEHYRTEAESKGLPPDPEWDEWEREALEHLEGAAS